mmetsp:Transcript_10017/g.21019  ORF Transcript_10017/g.21019 Transcript_10017/m.21019 type:complete len:121 (+) Transcript_10017:279-641(+)
MRPTRLTQQQQLTGVWIGDSKVCAIGVAASSWITMHGFALNVNTEMSWFDKIVPCGIGDKSVTRISDYIPNVSLHHVRSLVAHHLKCHFHLDLHHVSISSFHHHAPPKTATNPFCADTCP